MSMFGSGDASGRKKATAVNTLVGELTEIRGDVLFSGGLHVDGRIRGKVIATVGEPASLSISEQGAVEGDISVPILTVNGTVSGNVYASEKMTLAARTGDRQRVLQRAGSATRSGGQRSDGA